MRSPLLAVLCAIVCLAVAMPASAAAPDAPNRLRQKRISASQVRLIWRDLSPNEAGFEIFRRPQTENAFQSRGVVGANVTQFVDDAPKGTVYIYQVVAFNDDGDSRGTNDCYVNRTPPAIPIYFNVRLIALTVARVSWSDRANGEGGYEIQRAVPGKRFKTIVKLPPNSTTYDDYGLAPANNYVYRVRAQGRPAICWINSGYSVQRALTTKGGVRLLQIELFGHGKGTVTSIPEGISCGFNDDHCIAEFPLATDVTLVAKAAPRSNFKGWIGIASCEGKTDPCTINLKDNKVLGALFRTPR